MAKTLRKLLAGLLAALVPALALAHDIKFADLTIQHPWTRPSDAAQSDGCVYMKIDNRGSKDATLVAAASSIAAEVSVPAATTVPAGGSIILKPGGPCLALHGLKKPLKSGLGFPLQLTFAPAGKVELYVSIAQRGMDPHLYHH